MKYLRRFNEGLFDNIPETNKVTKDMSEDEFYDLLNSTYKIVKSESVWYKLLSNAEGRNELGRNQVYKVGDIFLFVKDYYKIYREIDNELEVIISFLDTDTNMLYAAELCFPIEGCDKCYKESYGSDIERYKYFIEIIKCVADNGIENCGKYDIDPEQSEKSDAAYGYVYKRRFSELIEMLDIFRKIKLYIEPGKLGIGDCNKKYAIYRN